MKGDFFVHQIGDIVYSTNSVFWHSFFTDTPLPGAEIQKGKLEPVNFDIVTHNGEIIHRFKEKK